jgi:hypothetical protein
MEINMYRDVVFPAWYEHWQNEADIDTVRENNEQVYTNLSNLDVTDFGNANATINAALNSVHASGSMLDHVNEKFPDVDSNLLDSLSNSDTSEWDQELAELGA